MFTGTACGWRWDRCSMFPALQHSPLAREGCTCIPVRFQGRIHQAMVDPGHTETLVHQTLVRLRRSWRQSGWRLVVCMGVVHKRKNHPNYKSLGSKGMPSLKWNRPENSVGTSFSTQQWYDVHFGVHRCKNFPALKHAFIKTFWRCMSLWSSASSRWKHPLLKTWPSESWWNPSLNEWPGSRKKTF